MKFRTFAATIVLAALTAGPALAADKPVALTLDGRSVDRSGGIAVARNGVVYADLIDLNKAFDGLLTLAKDGSARVLLNGTTATFAPGSRTMRLDQGSVTMAGAAFVRNGDLYVPLNAFVTRVAKARVSTNASLTRADIRVAIDGITSPAAGVATPSVRAAPLVVPSPSPSSSP